LARRVVTLVPEYLARSGSLFLFIGPSTPCSTCRYRGVCVDNLVEGRVYEVLQVIPKKRFRCPLHGADVVPVEATTPLLEAALPERMARIGAIVKFSPPQGCGVDCPSIDLCHPPGLRAGDKVRIVEVLKEKKVECPRGERMVLCRLEVQEV